MDIYYLQPRYYSQFVCLADKCVENCCQKWRIDWFKREYQKLLDADCSEELRNKISEAFKPLPDSDDMVIKLNENEECPFINEHGLCYIQKELGHEYLSVVCQLYPRNILRHNDKVIRNCSPSCPGVLELLFNDERAMELELHPARDITNLLTKADVQSDIDKYPKLFFRVELLNFFFDILSNKRRSVETSIIIGALAAKKLSDVAETNKANEMIPRLIKELKPQLNSTATEKSINSIQPNYKIKLKLVNNTIVKFFGNKNTAIDLSPLYEDDSVSAEKYLKGLENFRNVFGENDQAFRNLVLNSFMFLNMPFKAINSTIFENYSFFTAVCAVFRMVSAVVGLTSNNIRNDFILIISRFIRTAEHNIDTINSIIKDLNELGFNSAAHLALMIK